MHPSCSPHGAPGPLYLEERWLSSTRFDFRGLNQISKKDWYPLHSFPTSRHTTKGMSLYQDWSLACVPPVWISPGDEWKTALQTIMVPSSVLVMPEGLTNAPTTFQIYYMDMIDVISINIWTTSSSIPTTISQAQTPHSGSTSQTPH